MQFLSGGDEFKLKFSNVCLILGCVVGAGFRDRFWRVDKADQQEIIAGHRLHIDGEDLVFALTAHPATLDSHARLAVGHLQYGEFEFGARTRRHHGEQIMGRVAG